MQGIDPLVSLGYPPFEAADPPLALGDSGVEPFDPRVPFEHGPVERCDPPVERCDLLVEPAEGGGRRVERRPDLSQLGAVARVGLAPAPAIQDLEARYDPAREPGVRRKLGVVRAVVAEVRGDEVVDPRLGIGPEAPRPGDVERFAEIVRDPVGFGEERLVSAMGALEAARTRLGVQHVPQPDQEAGGPIDAVPLFQGGGDVERIADRADDVGHGSEGSERLHPEPQQAAQAGVLDDEQPAGAELVPENGLRPLAIPLGDRRRVPARIERPPVVPGGPRGGQDLVVQIHDRPGLPEPRRVVARRVHQVGRQVAPQQVQQTGHRRGAAAVHSGDQDRDFSYSAGHRGFRGVVRGGPSVEAADEAAHCTRTAVRQSPE